ncbi:MAG: hypothetical protein ACFFDN_26610 [Candidatus Hodarchaeota archaeon]
MKDTIFIFDIDGCIMPNLFANFGWAGDQDREQVIQEVNKNGMHISLFPAFIKFFKIKCKNAQHNYFVTGRQRNEFEQLTLKQLEPIYASNYPFSVIWYPSNKQHTVKKYFTWKVYAIKAIIQHRVKENVQFMIYDDLPDYFKKIHKLEKKYKIPITVQCVKNNADWEKLNLQI